MNAQQQTIPEGYRVDAQKRLIPESMIKPIDLERDALVLGLVEKARAASDVLAKAGILQKGNDGKATSKHKTPDQPKESRRFYKFVKTERKDQGG